MTSESAVSQLTLPRLVADNVETGEMGEIMGRTRLQGTAIGGEGRGAEVAGAYSLDVVVVGAGISGIGTAIKLLDDGINDFVVLEKAGGLGGTWRDNTYPGCACDVPSHIYSYSFAQKPDWTRVFSGQAEILEYVHDTARRHGIERHIRLDEPMERADWDEARLRWRIRTPKAEYFARVLITCTGYLHEPQIPDLPGLAGFPGEVFHSSRWNHAHDLTGERVAVIGTGASAVQ